MSNYAKKIIKRIRLLPNDEKEKIYDFVLLEYSKNLSHREKRLARFGIQSIRKLQEWKKKANQTLAKSIELRNELGIKA